MKNDLNLGTTVDRLGAINAIIADMEKEAAGLKAILIASGQARVDGTLYKASIVPANTVKTVDWKGLALSMQPSPQRLAKYTGTSDRAAQVRVFDR